jgi:hypothetical protein
LLSSSSIHFLPNSNPMAASTPSQPASTTAHGRQRPRRHAVCPLPAPARFPALPKFSNCLPPSPALPDRHSPPPWRVPLRPHTDPTADPAASHTIPLGQGSPNQWEPVLPVRTGSGRFPTGPNSNFEFEFKNEKISQNSQKYFKVCRI